MDQKQLNILQGGISTDHRGQIRFVNDFDMKQVRRFYIIKNNDTQVIRGWRGHRIEKRWIYVISGTFSVDLVKIDNWEESSRELPIERHILKANSQQLLFIPAGYAMSFRAMVIESEMLVYADHGLENAKNDDYTWPTDYFISRND